MGVHESSDTCISVHATFFQVAQVVEAEGRPQGVVDCYHQHIFRKMRDWIAPKNQRRRSEQVFENAVGNLGVLSAFCSRLLAYSYSSD